MYKIGDLVEYRGAWGREAPVPARITGIGEKNGRLVYDCIILIESKLQSSYHRTRWGYENQFALKGSN